MSLALHEVKSIARDVVREYEAGFEVIAVTPGEGGESAEVIVAPGGIWTFGGLVSIPVKRAGTGEELRGSIEEGLTRRFGVPSREVLAD